MSLKPIRVMVSAVGCPGASTCIRYLKGTQEREVFVLGVDTQPDPIGRFLCDDFVQVPRADSPGYAEVLLEIAVRHEIDLFIPASSSEVLPVSKGLAGFEDSGIKVLVSATDVLEDVSDKHRLYSRFAQHPGVPTPEFCLVRSLEELRERYVEMGGRERPLCVKPPVSKGSRGFRYIRDDISRLDRFLNHKPDDSIISFGELESMLSGPEAFPELLLMEVMTGEEIDTMVLGMAGECLLITHKTRETHRGGVITAGEHVERPELTEVVRNIVREAPLSYNFGIQFIGGALLEINPRLSTFIYQPDWVEPYFAIKLALGELNAEDFPAIQARQPMGLRLVRYFDQHFFPRSDG